MSTISFDPRSFHTGQPSSRSFAHENIEAGDRRQWPLRTSENRRRISLWRVDGCGRLDRRQKN